MTMRAVASAHFSEENHLKYMYDWHCQHHPAMEPMDVVKLYFQAVMGCGHLLGEESHVAQRIIEEETKLSPSQSEPLLEPLGPSYVRLNLRRAMAEKISPQQIARLMKLSQSECLPKRASVVEALDSLGDSAVYATAQRLVREPNWLPNHTPAYHAAYSPAYRVISRKCAAVLPVLTALSNLEDKERLLLCIDGPCGSGKSTLAAILQNVLGAALVPMDDFFLPHPRKTAERLALPGGNADWERLRDEFLHPWLCNGHASYRPYDCHINDYGKAIVVSQQRITIIEGSYSMMPDIRKHADLCIFLQVSADEQQRRILERNGPRMLQMFNERWIPLEQNYFKAFHLPDQSCLVISQDLQFV